MCVHVCVFIRVCVCVCVGWVKSVSMVVFVDKHRVTCSGLDVAGSGALWDGTRNVSALPVCAGWHSVWQNGECPCLLPSPGGSQHTQVSTGCPGGESVCLEFEDPRKVWMKLHMLERAGVSQPKLL